MPYRKILVPVDYSPSSVQAFAEAVKLARALGSRVSVLHVRPAPTGSGTTGELSVPVESEAANTTFHGLLDAARKELGDRVEVLAVDGEPAAQILEQAARAEHDLIVMGTHGRVGRLHMLVGSVAQGVMRNASCPVLTVRVSDGSEETLKDRLRGGSRVDERG